MSIMGLMMDKTKQLDGENVHHGVDDGQNKAVGQ
jgi:hypothetical protein